MVSMRGDPGDIYTESKIPMPPPSGYENVLSVEVVEGDYLKRCGVGDAKVVNVDALGDPVVFELLEQNGEQTTSTARPHEVVTVRKRNMQ